MIFEVMKKNLFIAFFACVALAFVSCGPDPVNYTISLNQTEITLGVGATAKLNAVISPVVEQAPVITWTSSNPEVAKVNASGVVEGLEVGIVTITASLNIDGVEPATCQVNVTNDAVFDNFELGGYGCFGDYNPEYLIAGTDTVFTISVGEVKCQLGWNTLYAWDSNILFVNGQGFSGAGFMMVGTVPTYFITEGDYAGYYIDMGYFGFMDELGAYIGQAGKLLDVNTYGDALKTLINPDATEAEVNAAVEGYYNSFEGTQVVMIDFDNQQESNYLGNVKYALGGEGEDGSMLYDIKMEWFDFVNANRYLGLACVMEENEKGQLVVTEIVEPYDMRTIEREYSNMPIQEALVKSTKNWVPVKPSSFNPEKVRANFDTKIMYKK